MFVQHVDNGQPGTHSPGLRTSWWSRRYQDGQDNEDEESKEDDSSDLDSDYTLPPSPYSDFSDSPNSQKCVRCYFPRPLSFYSNSRKTCDPCRSYNRRFWREKEDHIELLLRTCEQYDRRASVFDPLHFLTPTSLKDISKSQANHCVYCGCSYGRKFEVDRIKGHIGHTQDNCVLCCAGCRQLRQDMDYSFDEFMVLRNEDPRVVFRLLEATQ